MSAATYQWVTRDVVRRKTGKTHKQRYRVRDRSGETPKAAPLQHKTKDGHHWVERAVTRAATGKTHRQWFRVKGPHVASSPVSLRGLSHADLGADKFRPGVLEHLRKDKGFERTGHPTFASKRLAERAREQGFDSLTVRRREDGSLFLVDGAHRLQVAREKGLRALPGVVRDSSGRVTYRGEIPI